MAVTFPAGIEVFGNVSTCVIATNGYAGSATSDAPAAGTTESWTMGTGYTSFPDAQNTSTPNNYFYIRDLADTTNEVVLVYTGGGSGTTWSVQRGMNGATVSHAAGATWVQEISPYTLQNMKQAPGNVSSAITVGPSSATETVLASYTPLSTDVLAGTSFRLIAFGGLGWASRPTLQIRVMWGGSGSAGGAYTATGGVQLAKLITGTNAVALTPSTITAATAGYSWDVEGSVTLITPTTATCNINMWYTGSSLSVTASNASTVNSATGTPFGSSASPITISGLGPLFLTATWGASSASNVLTATAPIIFRDT